MSMKFNRKCALVLSSALVLAEACGLTISDPAWAGESNNFQGLPDRNGHYEGNHDYEGPNSRSGRQSGGGILGSMEEWGRGGRDRFREWGPDWEKERVNQELKEEGERLEDALEFDKKNHVGVFSDLGPGRGSGVGVGASGGGSLSVEGGGGFQNGPGSNVR